MLDRRLRFLFCLFFSLAAVSFVSGQTMTFFFKNAEPRILIAYWILPGNEVKSEKEIVRDLASAHSGRQLLAPMETRPVELPVGYSVAVAFLDWTTELSFRTPIDVAFLLRSEAPAGKSVVLTRENFLAFNRTRKTVVALQDLNLLVPQFELDGETQDWNKVLALAEFGPTFQPTVRTAIDSNALSAWRADRERSSKIGFVQAAVFDRVLWFRVKFEASKTSSKPESASIGNSSLQWSWSSRALRANVSEPQGTVWFSTPGQAAQSVGRFVVRGGDVEVWIPLDRFSPSERASLYAASIDFSRIVEFNKKGIETFYTSFRLQELP